MRLPCTGEFVPLIISLLWQEIRCGLTDSRPPLMFPSGSMLRPWPVAECCTVFLWTRVDLQTSRRLHWTLQFPSKLLRSWSMFSVMTKSNILLPEILSRVSSKRPLSLRSRHPWMLMHNFFFQIKSTSFDFYSTQLLIYNGSHNDCHGYLHISYFSSHILQAVPKKHKYLHLFYDTLYKLVIHKKINISKDSI